MIYRTHNLTGCIVALKSKASMRQFLRDRQRSVESKMRKAIKAGLRAGCPVAGGDASGRSMEGFTDAVPLCERRNRSE